MEGALWKWTNYVSGWQQRWFVLDSGVLSYYLSQKEVDQGSRGSLKVASCEIIAHPHDLLRMDLIIPGERHIYLRASTHPERQKWLVAMGTMKQEESSLESTMHLEKKRAEALSSKMVELHLSCQLLTTQLAIIKTVVSQPNSPDSHKLEEMSHTVSSTCDRFLNLLAECMDLTPADVCWSSALKPLVSKRDGINSSLVSPAAMINADFNELCNPDKGIMPSGLRRSYHPLPNTSPSPSTPMAKLSTVHIASNDSGLPAHIAQPPITPPVSSVQTASNRNLSTFFPYSLEGENAFHWSTVSKHATVHRLDEDVKSVQIDRPGPDSPVSPDIHVSSYGSDSSSNLLQSGSNVESSSSAPQLKGLQRHVGSQSDVFLTPKTSPVSTPQPSPPQTPVLSHRVGDRTNCRTRSIQVETFFSRASDKKFEDLILTDDDEIPTVQFLACCRAVAPFFDTLSPTAFSPVKADINGNIEKLAKKHATNPESFSTLQSLVLHELRTNTQYEKNSSTDALLWLKRALEFIHVFTSEIVKGEQSLNIAAVSAYGKTLRRFHNWIIRGIFSFAVKAVPCYQDFMNLLGSDGTTQGNDIVIEDMANFSASLGYLVKLIGTFYIDHKLDDTLPLE